LKGVQAVWKESGRAARVCDAELQYTRKYTRYVQGVEILPRSRQDICWRKARRRSTMAYIDGFVIAVPKKNVKAYKAMSTKAGKIWMEYGALQFRECIADDVKPGKLTSFPQSVKLKKDEVVFFSYIVYKSRKDRDRINKKVMADPRLKMDGKEMPFDAKRMIWGGFKTLVDL
jgi:uncharacterized protein YbaA (DUF1428 family)